MVSICMRVAAVLLLAFVAAGCGHDDAKNGSRTATEDVTTAEIAAPSPTETDVNHNGRPDSDPADQDWPGRMTVVFEDATTPEAVRGRKFMEANNLLQQFADDINSTLKLPFDITLKGSQCGQPNDFWSSSEKAITMCYEDATNALDIFARLGDADPDKSAFGTELEAFYHESGHMVISIYDLPATGREEDVADQAATFLMFRPVDGKIDPDSVDAIKNTARLYKTTSEDAGDLTDDSLADVHSPDRTRMYNFECWAYGAAPDQSSDLVTDGLLPEDRAEGCQDEYQKLDHAWGTLLAPYLR